MNGHEKVAGYIPPQTPVSAEDEAALKPLARSLTRSFHDLVASHGVLQDKPEMLRRGLDYGGDGLDTIAISVHHGIGPDRVSNLHARRPFSDDVDPKHR